MFLILHVFQTEISGKYFKDEQSKNNPDMFLILHVFHLEISGIFSKE